MATAGPARDPARTLTDAFYRWEIWGRGWMHFPHPVRLEPPFEPFVRRPAALPGFPDDGRKPTLLSRVAAWLRARGRSAAQSSDGEPDREPRAAAWDERDPFPIELELLVPRGFETSEAALQRFLTALPARHPVSFEMLGRPEAISLRFACDATDESALLETAEAFFPAAAMIRATPLLDALWRGGGELQRVVLELGLTDEFMLPLAAGTGEALLQAVCAAVGRLGAQELGMVQVLFQAASAPWAPSMLRALGDGRGGAFFADAPETLGLARLKVTSPLFAVVVRLAAQAPSSARAWEIARRLAAAMNLCERPGSNALTAVAELAPEEDHVLTSRTSHRLGMLLSAEELASLVPLPTRGLSAEKLTRLDEAAAPPPSDALGHAYRLGQTAYRGAVYEVSLSVAQRLRHIHVIGASGSGKSTLLAQLVLQDVAAGHGIALLDPHGDLVDEILARIPPARADDVLLLDPGDDRSELGFNPLRATTERERELLGSDLVAVFRRLSTSWGDQMNAVLANAIAALLARPDEATLLELRRFLVDAGFRRDLLASARDAELLYFWEKVFPHLSGRPEASVLTRLNAFLRARCVRATLCPAASGLDLGQVLQRRQVLLARLSQGLIGEENAYLLGSVLVAKLHQAALGRQILPPDERPPFFLYVDEFQHFATPSMATMLSGGRKFGLGLVLAHQSLGQLDGARDVRDAVLANAFTRIAFRLGSPDARTLAASFPSFEAHALESLPVGVALAHVGQNQHDFRLAVDSLPAADRALAAAARERVHGRRPREGLETVPLGSPPPVPTPPVSRRQGVQPATTQPNAVPSSRPSRPMTTKPTPGRGGHEHKYLQQLVKQLAEQRGYQATIECTIPGEGGRIDVALSLGASRVACEISVSSTPAQEASNIRKCLRAGFGRVLLIAPHVRRRAHLAAQLATALTDDERACVVILAPDEIPEHLDEGQPAESTRTVSGYRVRLEHRSVSAGDASSRREVIGRVIARSLLDPAKLRRDEQRDPRASGMPRQ